MFRKSLAVLGVLASFYAHANFTALTVPDNIRITSSAPRKVVWATLTPKEKKLAAHLLAAADAGKFILLHQNHRYGLLIKNMLETSLTAKNLPATKKLLGNAFTEYLNYTIKYEDQVGPYTTSNRKYVLKKVSAAQVGELFRRYSPKASATSVLESVRLLTDPDFEVILKPEGNAGNELAISGNNIYEHGITEAEVEDAIHRGMKSDVNCRIVRGGPTGLKCQVQALNNPELPQEVRNAMTEVVKHLKAAVPLASSDHQKKQIEHLIRYFELGDVEDFRQMNVHWVKDGTSSKVDFMMGYVEYQTDYKTLIGSWESYVQIVDPETTKMSVNLARNAQEFENNMPYGQYKKTFPDGYSPPALMVYYFQEISSFRSGGYNLPNYDDIRRDVGAKNIIRLDLPGQDLDPNTIKDRREMYDAYAPVNKVNDIVNFWTQGRKTKVLLHEIIGHGSGTYNTGKYGPKEDPTTALGALGSSLEEQRADLAALVFGADPIMVKIGMFKNQEEAIRSRNAMYDAYNANFLRDVSKQQSLSEAHHRGHWLMMNILLEKGAIVKASKGGAAQWTDETVVYIITDYEKYYQVSKELLGRLQLIKAEREEQELKAIYEKYAPLAAIREPWLQAIIKRGENL
ncbi:MAG: dipeptidyl-peptidase 3 family protein, partial [Bacteriovoracaceae bacterium]